MAEQALDVEFHWVTEHGQDGKLTAGATIKATVSVTVHDNFRVLTVTGRLQVMPSTGRCSYGSSRDGIHHDSG